MRDAWWGEGNFVEFSLAVNPEARVLRVLYWGGDVNKDFVVMVDGRQLVRERREGPAVERFVAAEYPLPDELTQGKDSIRVRFETRTTDAPFYEARILS
jgi:hypothetical protein